MSERPVPCAGEDEHPQPLCQQLADDGVRAVGAPEVQKLKERGASLFGCAYGAHRRHIAVDDSAAWSGLTVLADVVGSTDRFVSF